MLSSSQKDNESNVEFPGRLKRLAEDCECTSLTVQARKDYSVRETLITGLRSDVIWSWRTPRPKSLAAYHLLVLRNNQVTFRNLFEVLNLQLLPRPGSSPRHFGGSRIHLRCPTDLEQASVELSVLRPEPAPTLKVPSQKRHLSQMLQRRILGVGM